MALVFSAYDWILAEMSRQGARKEAEEGDASKNLDWRAAQGCRSKSRSGADQKEKKTEAKEMEVGVQQNRTKRVAVEKANCGSISG